MEENSQEVSLLWAQSAVEAALTKKAYNAVIISVKSTLVIVDYFVVLTVDNQLQLIATVDTVEETLKKEYGIRPIGREGIENTGWVLLDYGDIVVHIFTPEVRDFYRLETLYNDAKSITYDDA